MNKTICILLADGFEETEAILPADIFKRLNLDVILAGINDTNICGAHGICLTTQTTINDITPNNFDVLMLPGGLPGTINLRDSQAVISLIKQSFEQNKICAAICAAPIVLQEAGIANNKRITGYPECEQLATKPNFKFTGADIEIDGNIITAKGMGKATEFAFAIADAIGISQTQINTLASGAFINI